MKKKVEGFSLVELLVVVAGILILVSLALPVIQTTQHSLETTISIQGINGLLSMARATSRQLGRYAGIRFQQTDEDVQYAVLIMSEPTLYRDYPAPQESEPMGPIPCVIAMGSGGQGNVVNLGKSLGIAADTVIAAGQLDIITRRVTMLFGPDGKLTNRLIVMRANPTLDDDIYNDTGSPLFPAETTEIPTNIGFVIYDIQEWKAARDADQEPEFWLHQRARYVNRYSGQVIRHEL